MALILDGKKVAESLYQRILLDLSLLPVVPKIMVVLVGDDPASATYVRSKTKKCLDLGFQGETVPLPANTSEAKLIQTVTDLGKDPGVHAILVQLPLPAGINKSKVLAAIPPLKDVDGLTVENAGRLFQGAPRFVPCTPAGILEMLRFYKIPIAGKHAVVVGRSEIVGKPMAQLLLGADATVTMVHSKTPDLASETLRADLLVVAAGKPGLIQAEHVKEGAVVIDVGIHRLPGPDGGYRLAGDVDYQAVSPKCAAITPVPGGVGPLTIAMLMKNVAEAAKLQTRESN